jgi:hypothetical protein
MPSAEGDMSTQNITYENVGAKLVEKLPELKEKYERELSYWGNDFTGYIVFFVVVNPHLEALLDSPEANRAALQGIFEFFERMAVSQDMEAVNLLWVEVLEMLVANPPRLAMVWPLMGERTRKLTRECAKRWHRDDAIPT